MSAIQVPLYNFIRAAFRSAPIHTSASSFFTAMDVWLAWLQPWMHCTANNGSPGNGPKTPLHMRRGNSPNSMTRKIYDQRDWEPYVAANLCFYTVPLAIFLRRARELDFSASNFHKAYAVINRVFAVYTPELVHTINLLAQKDTRFTAILDEHFERLGPFGPPTGVMTLASCDSDMRLLLEEMHMHHFKKLDNMDVFDRISAKFEGFFGRGAVSGEEKCLLQLVERAKILVGLSDTYQIYPGREDGAGDPNLLNGQGDRKPARTKDGRLTEEGRDQLLRGEVVCSPLDVRIETDPMKRTVVGTHEIGWLVTCLTWLSIWLNGQLGLPTYQINLRFLADYRNLAFTCLFGYIVLNALLKFLLRCLS